jgi:hypothetical protein
VEKICEIISPRSLAGKRDARTANTSIRGPSRVMALAVIESSPAQVAGALSDPYRADYGSPRVSGPPDLQDRFGSSTERRPRSATNRPSSAR